MINRKIRLLFLIIITVVGTYYFYQKGSEFVELVDFSIKNFVVLSLAVLISYFFYGFKLKCLFDPFNIRLSTKEWIGLPMILHFGNFIFFKAGTATLAIYLKNHYQLAYTKFIAIMAAEKFFLFYSMCLLGLAWTFFIDITLSQQIYSVMVVLVLVTVLTWVLFYFSFKKPNWENWAGQTISKLFDAWHFFRNNNLNIIKLIIIQAIIIVSWGFRFFISFNILNNQMSFIACLGLALAVFLTGLINLIPGGLGIREVTVGIFMTALGLNFDFGVYAVTVDRVLSSLWFTVLGIFFFNFLHLKSFEKDPKTMLLEEVTL